MGSSQIFRTASEVLRDFPDVDPKVLDHFVGRYKDTTKFEVYRVAPEKWLTTISGDGWAVSGTFASSETGAILKAVRAALQR